MRQGPLVAVSLTAACLGAVLAVALGQGTGWLDGGTKTTVVVQTAPDASPVSAAGAARAAARPLSGSSFDPARIYATRVPGVVTLYSFFDPSTDANAREAQGTGFVVSAGGVILTSAHVITDAAEVSSSSEQSPPAPDVAKEVYVEFHDGDRVPAEVVGYDLFDDVGVIRVDPKAHALAPVPLGDSSAVVVGEPVAAIGTPFGNEGSLTVGVVSATRPIDSLTSRYDVVDAIQTDAPITHGNSGGPLFDARGRVIGINAQIRTGQTQSGFEGVGFAVPVNSAKRSMQQLLANGRVVYAYLGVRTEDLTPAIAKRFGYGVDHGALIDVVQPGTAAERAGLRAGSRDVLLNGETVRGGGDVIVAIDGIPVQSSGDLVRIVSGRLVPGRRRRSRSFAAAGTRRSRCGWTSGRPEAGLGFGRNRESRPREGRVEMRFRQDGEGLTREFGVEDVSMDAAPTSGGPQAIQLTIPARAEYITLGRLALTGLARVRQLTEDELGDLKLAITEACTNSVRHAYGGDDGRVEIVYELHPDRLVVEVVDDGEGFVPGTAGATEADELSEGGLGIVIIRALTDELEIGPRADGRGSRLRFVKFLTAD